MASGSPMALVGGVCFFLATLFYFEEWRGGTWLAAAGAAILAGALAARGLQAGRWPLADDYEVALTFALCTALAAAIWDNITSNALPTVQVATMGIATLLVTYARIILPETQQALHTVPPTLDSAWLPLHVSAAAMAFGALALAGSAGLAWLLQERLPREDPKLPKRETEWLQYRAVAAGFPLLTLSMIFGMIWAQVAWGRFWDWNLKEMWTLITWAIYVLYWHVRRRPRWTGARLAWLAVAGLSSALFTFLAVDWLARIVELQNVGQF
jgi:cytochrome c-type biogenesis protein CcsB